MKHKTKIILFFYFSLVPAIILVGAFYIYDPIQVFHKSWIHDKSTVYYNIRQQALGIIDNNEFDSVIFGSSMLQNTSSIEAGEKLGGNFVNISISSADFYERALILNYLFKQKKIKKVFYSLDYVYFTQRIGKEKYPLDEFDFLYDANEFNNIKTYLNKKFLKCLTNFSEYPECIGIETTLDRPRAWYRHPKHKRTFGGLKNWIKYRDDSVVKKQLIRIIGAANKKEAQGSSSFDYNEVLKAFKYIDENLIQLIENNPDTEFILLFPPYSLVEYSIWEKTWKNKYFMHKEVLKYLATKSSLYKNMKVYDFSIYAPIDRISHYKDLLHYSERFNSLMIKWVKNDLGLLTSLNVERHIDRFDKRVKAFDLTAISNEIKSLVRSEKIKKDVDAYILK